MISSRSAIILSSLNELNEPVHVTGTTPAARAFLLARFAQDRHKKQVKKTPLLVICATDDEGIRLLSDIETLSVAVDEFPLQLLQFPTWEQSPYTPIAPSLKTR